MHGHIYPGVGVCPEHYGNNTATACDLNSNITLSRTEQYTDTYHTVPACAYYNNLKTVLVAILLILWIGSFRPPMILEETKHNNNLGRA